MLHGDTLLKLSCGLRELKSPFHKRYLFPFVEFLRLVPPPPAFIKRKKYLRILRAEGWQ